MIEVSIQIFGFKTGFLAIPVYLRTAIASDRGRTVDNPVSDEFRIMADFQYLQLVTPMEYPFSDITYILRETYIFQMITFEKSAVFQNFQRIRQIQRSKIAEIECLSTDPLQLFRERNGL